MIEPIVIKVTDKVPELISAPYEIVCDNSDYSVVWQLDEEWALLESRTMIVRYRDGTHDKVLFTGNTCYLPAIPVDGHFYVGLFAGDIHTTKRCSSSPSAPHKRTAARNATPRPTATPRPSRRWTAS